MRKVKVFKKIYDGQDGAYTTIPDGEGTFHQFTGGGIAIVERSDGSIVTTPAELIQFLTKEKSQSFRGQELSVKTLIDSYDAWVGSLHPDEQEAYLAELNGLRELLTKEETNVKR